MYNKETIFKKGDYVKKIGLFLLVILFMCLSWFLIMGKKTHWMLINEISGLKSLQVIQQDNGDVYAWLKVEGTKIDYPVAQHVSDDTYYLNHDIEGSVTYYGAIFTEKINQKNFLDPITIIYGHGMRDGSMFGTLEYFSDKSFFNKNEQISIQTEDSQITYEVFSAYSGDDLHLFESFNLGEESSRETYVASIRERTIQWQGNYRETSLTNADRLVVLSTCDSSIDGKRFIVHAVERKRASMEEE